MGDRSNNQGSLTALYVFWVCGTVGILVDIFDAIAILFNTPSWLHDMEPAVALGVGIGVISMYALARRLS